MSFLAFAIVFSMPFSGKIGGNRHNEVVNYDIIGDVENVKKNVYDKALK